MSLINSIQILKSIIFGDRLKKNDTYTRELRELYRKDELEQVIQQLAEDNSTDKDLLIKYFNYLFLYKKEFDKESPTRKKTDWLDSENLLVAEYIDDTDETTTIKKATEEISRVLKNRTQSSTTAQYYKAIRPVLTAGGSLSIAVSEEEAITPETEQNKTTTPSEDAQDDITSYTVSQIGTDEDTSYGTYHTHHDKEEEEEEEEEEGTLVYRNDLPTSDEESQDDDVLNSISSFIQTTDQIQGFDVNKLFQGLAQLSNLAVQNQKEEEKRLELLTTVENKDEKIDEMENELQEYQETIKGLVNKLENIEHLFREFSQIKGGNKIVALKDFEVRMKQELKDFHKDVISV